jgi:hypothetical protein
MALPSFFIIGAAKSGTTSLHHYLGQHPEIQMSSRKEPNFFSGVESAASYTFGRISDLKGYERLFDSTMQVRGESSPSYADFPRHKKVPERIKELVPEAKIIYLVRDPIDRTISHFQHRVAIGSEQRSLAEALKDLPDPYSALTCPSLYASQLDLYLQYFPRDRILVVDHADLLAERGSTLREIFAFLTVDDTFDSVRFDDEVNRSSGRHVYPPGLARFMWRSVTPRLRWVHPRIRTSFRRSLEGIFLPSLQMPILESDLRSRLEELYTGEVSRLRALTGKTFPTWSI